MKENGQSPSRSRLKGRILGQSWGKEGTSLARSAPSSGIRIRYGIKRGRKFAKLNKKILGGKLEDLVKEMNRFSSGCMRAGDV